MLPRPACSSPQGEGVAASQDGRAEHRACSVEPGRAIITSCARRRRDRAYRQCRDSARRRPCCCRHSSTARPARAVGPCAVAVGAVVACGGVVVELWMNGGNSTAVVELWWSSSGCSGRALNAVHASRPLRDPGSRGWAAGDSQLIDGHGERLAHLDGPRPDLCVRRSEAETEREHQSVGRAVGMQTCSPFKTSRAEDLDTRRRNGNALIDTDRRRDGSCSMSEDGASAVLAT